MKAIFENVTPATDGIWRTNLDPKSLLRLASPARQGGKVSVVMVSHPQFEKPSGKLEFDLLSVALLNLGNSEDVVIIDSLGDAERQIPVKAPKLDQESELGDALFLEHLSKLSSALQELGRRLLDGVRREFTGELKLTPSGKFVEQPDNFWTVRIQPRAKSFRITVYGTPIQHGSFGSIEIKPDMAVYSAFVIDKMGQLDEALQVIHNAKRLKDRR